MRSKILIIDDEKIICSGLSKQLTKEGFEVEWALKGQDGIEMVKEKGYGIAIVDLTLPDVDGLHVCKHLIKENPNIKTIIMSGHIGIFEEKKEDFDKFCASTQFIYKPFEKENLLKMINKALEDK